MQERQWPVVLSTNEFHERTGKLPATTLRATRAAPGRRSKDLSSFLSLSSALNSHPSLVTAAFFLSSISAYFYLHCLLGSRQLTRL